LNSKFITLSALALVLVISFAALYVVIRAQANNNLALDRETLFQISAFSTFSSGKFSGNTTYSELAKHGDFGIGTLNGLDGEMIALDGVFYQIPVDGKPVQIKPSSLTPYATVTFFEADQTLHVNALNYSELTKYINQSLPSGEAIYAIKVSGVFDYAKTRSVPMQNEPYPTLNEAVSHQSIFNLNNVSATAAGFYFPNSMSGVDFAGYHLHFLTDDHLAGGHLLDCVIRNATVEIDYTYKYTLMLPAS
jgi:acetolactate decarboxylase